VAVRRWGFVAILAFAFVGAVVSLSLSFLLLPLVLAFAAPSVVAAALLAGLFLPKFSLAESPVTPERALHHLAHELRVAQYHVTERPGRIDVRIGRISAVKIWARPGPAGSVLRYQPDATPTGWGLIMFFAIPSGLALGFVAVLLVLYVFIQTHRFVASRVGPSLSTLRAEVIPPSEEVRGLLIDGLSEARRLAEEALEAERASHQDAQAVVFLTALLTWVLLLVGTFLLAPAMHPWREGWNPLLIATVPSAVLGLVSGILVWRRFRPRIQEIRRWVRRLQTALAVEISSEIGKEFQSSAFETLMEASQEVPQWIEAHRRAGLSRDPAAGYLLVGMALWTLVLVEVTLLATGFGPFVSALSGIGAIGLGLVLVLFYRRWRHGWEEAARASVLEWRRRLDEVRARMDRYLQEL